MPQIPSFRAKIASTVAKLMPRSKKAQRLMLTKLMVERENKSIHLRSSVNSQTTARGQRLKNLTLWYLKACPSRQHLWTHFLASSHYEAQPPQNKKPHLSLSKVILREKLILVNLTVHLGKSQVQERALQNLSIQLLRRRSIRVHPHPRRTIIESFVSTCSSKSTSRQPLAPRTNQRVWFAKQTSRSLTRPNS